MYNRLYKYLLQNNPIYEKRFGFQASDSTENAVIQLISKILDALNLKLKTFFNPWMTKRLQKSSKRKQKLQDNFLSPKQTKMKRDIRTINLYWKFLTKF